MLRSVLGIIVLTIVLCPIADAAIAEPDGFFLFHLSKTEQCEQLVKRFSSTTFIVWVIFPSFAGMMFNRLVGAVWIERLRDTLRLISAGTLFDAQLCECFARHAQGFLEKKFGRRSCSLLL